MGNIMKIKRFKNIEDISYNGQLFPKESNILLITGLSGSGKSYLAKNLSNRFNAVVFQPEWLIHSKHIDEKFKNLLEKFLIKYPEIKELVKNKWNNEKIEDKNILLKKYINLFFDEFLATIDNDKLYIVEGLQLFTLIDFNKVKDFPIIIKGTSSINSLKNRLKRDIKNKNFTSKFQRFKFKCKVVKQSRLYQFKHRKILNKFIKKLQTKNPN